jgi:hypothetical protein
LKNSAGPNKRYGTPGNQQIKTDFNYKLSQNEQFILEDRGKSSRGAGTLEVPKVTKMS